jgi:hypothetical protein
MRDGYVSVYTEENSNIYDPDSDWMFMWTHYYGTSIVLNDKKIFTCCFCFDDYMGGAHPLAGKGFVSIDLKTGKKIKIEDIFVEDYKQSLSELLDKKVRLQEQIAADASLTDHGYFVDNIQPNDNLYIALDGIGFYFNVYEISPYAHGPTDVFLTFAEIKHLIRADSPVRRIFE